MNQIAPEGLVTVTPYRDGPYLIRGPFRVVDQDGNEIAMSRPTIALCRCGKSRMRPLCDGTHRTIGFRAPSGAEAWPASDEPVAVDRPSEPWPQDRRTSVSGASQASRAPNEDDGACAPDAHQALLTVRTYVRRAHTWLEHALTPPLTAEAYTSLAIVEPLLQAADRLLDSILAGAAVPTNASPSPAAEEQRQGRSPSLRFTACRVAVEAALLSMPPASATSDRRVARLRSLLKHATETLRT